MTETFVRLPKVSEMVGLKKSEIYERIKAGEFPKQIRLSHRVAVWRQSEVENWMREVVK